MSIAEKIATTNLENREYSMASRKVNKSQAIRDFVRANRSSSANDVVVALGKKGIVVTAAMVANVKSKAGLTKKRKSSRAKKPAKSGAGKSIGKGLSVDALVEAKRLIRKAGSVEKAIEAIRVIDKLDAVAG